MVQRDAERGLGLPTAGVVRGQAPGSEDLDGEAEAHGRSLPALPNAPAPGRRDGPPRCTPRTPVRPSAPGATLLAGAMPLTLVTGPANAEQPARRARPAPCPSSTASRSSWSRRSRTSRSTAASCRRKGPCSAPASSSSTAARRGRAADPAVTRDTARAAGAGAGRRRGSRGGAARRAGAFRRHARASPRAACRLFDELEEDRVAPDRLVRALRAWAQDHPGRRRYGTELEHAGSDGFLLLPAISPAHRKDPNAPLGSGDHVSRSFRSAGQVAGVKVVSLTALALPREHSSRILRI